MVPVLVTQMWTAVRVSRLVPNKITSSQVLWSLWDAYLRELVLWARGGKGVPKVLCELPKSSATNTMCQCFWLAKNYLCLRKWCRWVTGVSICYGVILPTSGELMGFWHPPCEGTVLHRGWEGHGVFRSCCMKFTVLDGKVTSVNVAFVPARPAGRVLSSSNFFLGSQM